MLNRVDDSLALKEPTEDFWPAYLQRLDTRLKRAPNTIFSSAPVSHSGFEQTRTAARGVWAAVLVFQDE